MSSPVDINININKFLEWASERWERWSTICIVLFLVASTLLWKFTGTDIADLTLWEALLIVVVCVTIYGVWHISVRLPRCPRNHVGIGVAIAAESRDEYNILASDFIAALRRLLDRGGDVCNFALIELPQHHANKVRTTDDAIRVRQRCRCHFMIWGAAKLRPIGGRANHVLNLEGLVMHATIPTDVKNKFSREFSELFPRTVYVDRENDVISLEFTSEWVDCVARYIIGIAAAISGNIDYAENLFVSVHNNPRLRDCPLPAIKKIRQRTPVRLGEIYTLRGRLAYQEWRKTKHRSFLDEVHKHLTALAAVDPANYSGRLLRAVYHFVAEHNIKAALNEIRKCRDVRDATWRYSYAFLLAYQGQMQKARRMYKLAFAHYCLPSVPFEVEEFILRVLEEEPDKIQLHFCLGLVNWKGKNDKRRAIEDFKMFLDAHGGESFTEECRIACAYITTLEGELRNEDSIQEEPNKETEPTDDPLGV